MPEAEELTIRNLERAAQQMVSDPDWNEGRTGPRLVIPYWEERAKHYLESD